MALTEQKQDWFSEKNFNSLEIKKYKSIADTTIVRSVKIMDADIVNWFIARIEAIPSAGEKMKSFNEEAELIELMFEGQSPSRTIEIIQHGFKTPSTGFNFKNEIETELCNDIDALLFPAFNKRTPKIIGLSLNFEYLSIEYLGSEFRDYAPVTISFTIDKFVVRDKSQKEYPIEFRSGQLPPQPVSLNIEGHKIEVFTFRQNDRGIYPYYFEIVEHP